MRRIFWGIVGLGAGAVIGVAVVRWAAKTKERYAPPTVARNAGAAAAGFFDKLRDAIEVGREEMSRAETEIRTELGLPLQ